MLDRATGPGRPDEDPRIREARARLSAIPPVGPFWITRVERLSGEGELLTHKVYFEDAEGLDHHFFPYGDPQRRSGGHERFFDFTYRATIKPRIAEAWTDGEIGRARWETEFYRMALARTIQGTTQSYSMTSAEPHPVVGATLVRTLWNREPPPGLLPEPLTLFLPEPIYQRSVLPREHDLWNLEELDALLPED